MTEIDMNRNFLINGKSVISATLHIKQEQVDVTTAREPDPDWSSIDAAGHIHAYSKDWELPTLKPVQREVVCIDPDHDEDCEGYWITEYFCLICDEKIAPKMRETVGRRYKPGRYTWRVEFTAVVEDVLALDREKVSVWRTDKGKLSAFGVGLLSVQSISQQGIATGSILGAGELGQR